MYKRYVIYVVIIFISLVVVGNYLAYVTPNKKYNSLDFSSLDTSLYKRNVSSEGFIQEFLTEGIYELINGEYENFYNSLDENNRLLKFENSFNTFKEVIRQKYFLNMSEFSITYSGYSQDDNVYLYLIEIYEPIYITEEERKLEVYKPKTFYIAVNVNSDNKYAIQFDF